MNIRGLAQIALEATVSELTIIRAGYVCIVGSVMILKLSLLC